MERGPKIDRERRGKGRKDTLAEEPWHFENPARQRTGRLIGSASRTLLTCVDQRFISH